IDDFGTGYSSLSYLKRFPIDRIKIDQSFVSNITTEPKDAAVSQAIISMSHSLNLKTVAEGVETTEQLAFLQARQCDEVQGFHFSHPLPEEDMEQLLRKGAAFGG
ncbi:MAG: EAL domain-containing protein, partial [Gallionellaceae bacterium]|nr:EAL domain-containing protein [Gallionellaceae bacterium]